MGNRTRGFHAGWLSAVAAIAIGIGSPIAAWAQQREQVATIASYTAFQAGVLVSGFVPEGFVAPTIMAGSLLQTAPLWAVNLPEGALYTGLTAAGFGGYFLAPEGSIFSDSLGDAASRWDSGRTTGPTRRIGNSRSRDGSPSVSWIS